MIDTGARVWAYTPPPLQHPGQRGRWERLMVGAPHDEGGTSRIYRRDPFPASQTLIKLFKDDLSARQQAEYHAKLHTMTQRRVMLHQALPVVAWPEAVVFAEQKEDPALILGCTLPLVSKARSLIDFTTDLESLQALIPAATADTQRLIASNLAAAFALLHRHGVCFGDPNANNILVDTATFDVRLIDADSFGMTLVPPGSAAQVYYPPPVSTPGFRSPHVLAQVGPDEDAPIRSYRAADDDYVLAMHLFGLLVPGFYPFNGIGTDAQRLAMRRDFPYAGPTKSLPDDCAQMEYFNALPPMMQQAFVSAFVYVDPPPAQHWVGLMQAQWPFLRRTPEHGPVMGDAPPSGAVDVSAIPTATTDARPEPKRSWRVPAAAALIACVGLFGYAAAGLMPKAASTNAPLAAAPEPAKPVATPPQKTAVIGKRPAAKPEPPKANASPAAKAVVPPEAKATAAAAWNITVAPAKPGPPAPHAEPVHRAEAAAAVPVPQTPYASIQRQLRDLGLCSCPITGAPNPETTRTLVALGQLLGRPVADPQNAAQAARLTSLALIDIGQNQRNGVYALLPPQPQGLLLYYSDYGDRERFRREMTALLNNPTQRRVVPGGTTMIRAITLLPMTGSCRAFRIELAFAGQTLPAREAKACRDAKGEWSLR